MPTPLGDPAIKVAITDQIIRQGGQITTDDLIEAARAPDHPAHSWLWGRRQRDIVDDWRHLEASKLISAVRFEVRITPVDIQNRRFVVRDPTATAPAVSYVRVEDVRKRGDQDQIETMLDYYISQATTIIKKVADVSGQLRLRQPTLDRLVQLIDAQRLVADP
jgi:hypothetical protein